MRSLIGLFGLICGAVVIWTVAQYGYASADDPAARWNTAFLFGVIAAGGLFGHAVAVRVGRVSKPWAVMIVMVCGAALVINLSNSLAALAGRNSRSAAESANQSRAIRNDQVELGRLQKALDRLGAFNPTDQDAVDAAKRAADAATTAKERECGSGDPKQRGRFCRDKEDAERLATQALAKATADKALTDRSAKIEADMAPVRDRLRSAGPVVDTNMQGSALARLFRLPDSEAEFAATLQQFVLAGVVEALIVLSLVSFELLAPERQQSPRAPSRLARLWQALRSRPKVTVSRSPARPFACRRWSPVPSWWRAAPATRPVGAIPKILTRPWTLPRENVWKWPMPTAVTPRNVAKDSKRPVTPEQFAEPLARFCKGAGIRTKTMPDGSVTCSMCGSRVRSEDFKPTPSDGPRKLIRCESCNEHKPAKDFPPSSTEPGRLSPQVHGLRQAGRCERIGVACQRPGSHVITPPLYGPCRPAWRRIWCKPPSGSSPSTSLGSSGRSMPRWSRSCTTCCFGCASCR